MARTSFAIAAAALFAAAPALACDCRMLVPSAPHYRADLDAIAAFYSVAGEGRIERFGSHYRFRPIVEYRGFGRAAYPIGGYSTCALSGPELAALTGKRLFVILSKATENGKEVFEMGRCVNNLDAAVTADLKRRFRSAGHRL